MASRVVRVGKLEIAIKQLEAQAEFYINESEGKEREDMRQYMHGVGDGIRAATAAMRTTIESPGNE